MPGESHYSLATGVCSCEPDGKLVHLGATLSKSNALRPGDRPEQQFGDFKLHWMLASEQLPDRCGPCDGVDHGTGCMTEEQRSHPERIVDIVVSIDVEDMRARAANERQRAGIAGASEHAVDAARYDHRCPAMRLD
jgi:hypothetical protein